MRMEGEESAEERRAAAEAYLAARSNRAAERLAQRRLNEKERCPRDEVESVKTPVKRNAAFVKKLRSFGATQAAALQEEVDALNLAKYTDEAAAALLDAKLKMGDVAACVELCSRLHRRYGDFSSKLLEHWQRSLSAANQRPHRANPSKLRVDLRLYAELVAAGLFPAKPALQLLGNALTATANADRDEHKNAPALLSFCKHCGDEYAGLVPKKIKRAAEEFRLDVPNVGFLPPEKQTGVRTLLKDYYGSLLRHLAAQRQRALASTSASKPDELERDRTEFERLANAAKTFADLLDEELPAHLVDLTDELAAGVHSLAPHDDANVNVSVSVCRPDDPFDADDDARTFYTGLPDLKVFLPSYQSTTATVATEEVDEDDEVFNDDELEQEATTAVTATTKTTTNTNKYALDAFLNQLPECINRETIDTSAVDFVLNLNTKHNRKKLTRVLFGVARTRLDLLPFYARFAATLYPVVPDVATDLCQMLKQDFKYHVRKKDQINIESKVKVVRFIGELVKFALYSKMEALHCLKVLLHDFQHHHIEMACNLLETCGRYLYCCPETHQRMTVYLEQMMRIKSAKVMDSRHITQIENAYYYVCPPELAARAGGEDEPPLHTFIRKILHQELQKASEDRVLRLMRKIDWENEELCGLCVEWLAAGWRPKHAGRRCLARLVASLSAWQEAVGTRVVDAVLEDLRVTLEHPHPRHNQRRIAMARYLGELYNYKLVDSRDVFNALYAFITLGVDEPTLDPPDSAFRIRLVCVLLETCGAYFNSGSSKKKLDYFLTFFQNYYWYKRSDPCWSRSDSDPFPIYVTNMYYECLAALRPKLVLFKSWDECKAAVDEVKHSLFPFLDKDDLALDDHNETNTEQDGLETIVETDDEGVSDHPVVSNSSEDDEDDLTETDDNAAPTIEMEIMQDDVQHLPPQKQVEDVEFESALEKMVLENMSDRQREGRPSQRDISVPVHCRQQTKKSYEQLLQGSDSVEFVLMVRKGSKQQYKSFSAPSEMAINLKQQAIADKLEMERVKRLTLNITERQEEEEYCIESGVSSVSSGGGGSVGNPNRGLHVRHKYQHPKGAPDADLIFGPKRLK